MGPISNTIRGTRHKIPTRRKESHAKPRLAVTSRRAKQLIQANFGRTKEETNRLFKVLLRLDDSERSKRLNNSRIFGSQKKQLKAILIKLKSDIRKPVKNQEQKKRINLPNGTYFIGIIEGTFENNEFNGAGRLFFKNGKILYKGNFKSGKFHGDGMAFHPNRNIRYQGSFRQNKFHGIGTTFDENENKIYAGNFEYSKFHGEGILFHPNGNRKYKGGFRNDKRHGIGTTFDKNGNKIYEGNFADDMLQGKGKIFYSSGELRAEVNFRRGSIEGKLKRFRKNGQIEYHGNYKNGLRHGAGISYGSYGGTYDVIYYRGKIISRTVLEPASGYYNLLAIMNSPLIDSRTLNISSVASESIFLFKENLATARTNATEGERKIIEITMQALENYYPQTRIINSIIIRKLIRTKSPKLLIGGWKGHIVALVKVGNDVLICNKGQGTMDSRLDANETTRSQSIHHLKVSSEESITEVCKKINEAKGQEYRRGREILYEELQNIEGVELASDVDDDLFDNFRQVTQGIGNCWHTSPRTAVYGIMVLAYKNQLIEEGYPGDINSEARRLAKILYKKTISSRVTLKLALKHYIDFKQKEDPNYNPLKDPDIRVNPRKFTRVCNIILELYPNKYDEWNESSKIWEVDWSTKLLQQKIRKDKREQSRQSGKEKLIVVEAYINYKLQNLETYNPLDDQLLVQGDISVARIQSVVHKQQLLS